MGIHQKRGVTATKEYADKRFAHLHGSPSTDLSKAGLNARDPHRPLTQKQHAFIKYWVEGETPRSALLKAGYSSTTSSFEWKMKQDPAIMRVYHIEKKKFEEAAGFSRKKFMDGLLDAAEMAKLMAEPATMVAAYRELGKACGYYEPLTQRVEIAINGQIQVEKIAQMSDAELLKLIEAPIIEGQATRLDAEDTEDDDVEA